MKTNKFLLGAFLCTLVMGFTSCNENEPGISSNGACSHAFVVSASGEKIYFAKGNLQYQASTDTWRFAENQYDCIGQANANISSSYSGWIDLFGWGTGDNPTESTIDGIFYNMGPDWGINKISNASGKWRTLTGDEWNYILQVHAHANATVCGIAGLLLLPSDWEVPEGIYITPNAEDFTTNIFSTKQWSQLASAGAVFLPACGSRNEQELFNVGSVGNYWSATRKGRDDAEQLYFHAKGNNISYDDCYKGFSVRLITEEHNAENLLNYNFSNQPIDDKYAKTFIVSNDGKKVIFSPGNLQYQASTHTWRFAKNQYDYIGSNNSNISSYYSGWIDLFGWGTGDRPTLSSDNDKLYYSFIDWGINPISNGGNQSNQWRTLSNYEWSRIEENHFIVPATVCHKQGVILFPQYWKQPTDIPVKLKVDNGYETNTYNATQWRQMEVAGAVFLPAAGYRKVKDYHSGEGGYWSSYSGTTEALLFIISDSGGKMASNYPHIGRSVRLVQDVE